MIAVWLVGLIADVAVATFASRHAVVAALSASEVAGISPAFIGVTVMAVGTDLPEIANSIASALTGHGDIAVGDSAGSALTQVTLIVAILCFVAAPIHSDRKTIATIGAITVGALVLDGIVVRDQVFSRLNGMLLVAIWFISLVVGSSLVDATLAIGIGPAIRATVVSADAVNVCLIAACGVALATVVMTGRSSHGRRSATALFAVYLVATGALIVVTG